MTDTTTATLEPAGGRAKTMAKTVGLHMLDVWSHAPAGVARGMSDLWGWASFRKAYAAEMEGLTKPSDRIKAHTRLTERLGGAPFWRKAAVVLAALAVLALALNLLTSAGPAWWPLLLAMTYGAGRYALRPTKAVQDAAGDAPGREQQAVAEMLAAKLPGAGLKPDMFTVSALRPVFAPDAGRIGRETTIRLPAVAVADDVAKLRPYLAGVFGSRTDRIKVTEGTNPNQAIVFVADQSPSEIPAARWPIADATRTHRFITDPFPLGIDTATQKPVHVDLSDDAGIFITGLPGSGKTWTLRAFLAAAAADPKAAVILADFKGKAKDYRKPLDGTLDWAVFGNAPENLEAFRDVLVKVQKFMQRRIDHDLPEDPIVVAVDECQVALKDPAIVGLLEDLIKRGRSAGVRVFLSTQEPTQGSIPTKIRNVIGVHIGFRQNEVSSSLIALGGGLDDGMDCTKLPGGKDGQGLGFYAEGRVKVKAAKVDDDLAAAVASRGGGPTHAALFADAAPQGDAQPGRPHLTVVSDPEPEPDTILDHINAVWPTTDAGQPAPNAFLDHLLTRLPVTAGTYDGWGRPELRKAARAEGLEPREKVRVGDRLSPGFTYPDLMAAMGGSEATRTTRTP